MPEETSVTFSGTVAKLDESQNLVFGWASVIDKGGVVTDSQGDQIEPAVLEGAVYEYVLGKREAGEMHQRVTGVGKIVESVVFTVEKQKAMGFPEGVMPVGWWVGFKVEPDVFAKVKAGNYAMFSIGGRAVREPVDA